MEKKVFIEIMQLSAGHPWAFMDFTTAHEKSRELYMIDSHMEPELKSINSSNDAHKYVLDMRDYEVKYVANVFDGWVAGHYDLKRAFEKSDEEGLAVLFRQFNVDVELYRKYGSWKFVGHSLSMSDVVKVERIGSKEAPKYYYCDFIGWTEIKPTRVPLPFKVGTGVTINYPSDCYPAHISRISDSGKTFWIKRADYKRTDNNGLSEDQTYEITPNPDAPETMCKRRNNGTWYANGLPLTIGHARRYDDPHF